MVAQYGSLVSDSDSEREAFRGRADDASDGFGQLPPRSPSELGSDPRWDSVGEFGFGDERGRLLIGYSARQRSTP